MTDYPAGAAYYATAGRWEGGEGVLVVLRSGAPR